jgi:hypothetical protein
MIKSDMPMVLSDPGLDGTPRLTNVDLPTLSGDAVYAQCFQAKVMPAEGNWLSSYVGGL